MVNKQYFCILMLGACFSLTQVTQSGELAQGIKSSAQEQRMMKKQRQQRSCKEMCARGEQRCEQWRARRAELHKKMGRPAPQYQVSCKEKYANCEQRCELRRAKRAEYGKKYKQHGKKYHKGYGARRQDRVPMKQALPMAESLPMAEAVPTAEAPSNVGMVSGPPAVESVHPASLPPTYEQSQTMPAIMPEVGER